MTPNVQNQNYFDALMDGFNAVCSATEKAVERQRFFSKQLADELIGAQREALLLRPSPLLVAHVERRGARSGEVPNGHRPAAVSAASGLS